MTFHVCKEIDLAEYRDFESVMCELKLEDDVYVSDETDFCYFRQLYGSECLEPNQMPLILESALRFSDSHDDKSVLMVSVTSAEKHHKAWLEQAENYPGASITKLKRDGRTVYALLFPSEPNLEALENEVTD